MSGARPRIEVAAGLVFRGGRLLITRRPPGSHLGGRWEFPGGKREEGETLESCLRRELAEELGIEVVIHELIESVTHAYDTKTVALHFYRCSWKANEPQALGCPAFRWVTQEELSAYEFPEADVKLVEMLKTRGDMWPE